MTLDLLIWATFGLVVVAAFVIVLFEKPAPRGSTPISFEPKGFRDIYWCHHINEPEFMHFEAGVHPVCPGCRSKWKDPDDLAADEFHVFMFHVNKYLDWIDRT